ncbi:phospholipase D-like domain-containing protein, partial [Flavobacteriales bacterium]|nr:phospholipase D-like domain-containing protein [Flavobacteriales bacterium]
VRYITCASTATLALNSLDDNIPTLQRPEVIGIMHNKFIVIDANITDSAWVVSGSTNWTSDQIFNDPNHIIMVQDQSVARAYELEFNEMWGSDGDEPNATNAKFGSEKSDNTPHHFIVNGNDFEVYFSPSDNTTLNISNALNTADNDIHFALLVFTNNQLANTIAQKYDDGVDITGIIEQINTQGSEYEFLLDLGINVLSHQGFGESFHHKYCLIDHANTDSDPQVVTGSHNWSGGAETNNDENTMIIHDANITNQFYQEFYQRLNELENQVEPSFNCVGEACIDPMDGTGTYISLAACESVCNTSSIDELKNSDIQVYPNPNKGTFTLQIVGLQSSTTDYTITDIQGKIVVKETINVMKGMNTIEVNEAIKSGFYFVEIGKQRIKIIVQ